MWRDLRREERRRPPDRTVEITDVKTMGVHGNPKDKGGYYTWGIIKVETDTEHYGIGETFRGEEVMDIVGRMARHVIGENPLDTDRINELLTANYTGAGSIGQSAITAIETACCDIKGKVLGVPVYELLGGKYRDSVAVYADAEVPVEGTLDDLSEKHSPEAHARAARTVVGQGFEALKFDLDISTPGRPKADKAARRLDTPAIDHKVAIIEAVRDEVGYDVDLGVDLHWKFTVETALRLGKKLERFNLAFIEDPLHPRKLDAQARIKQKLDTPILTGENVVTASGFHELLQNDTLDIAAPDVTMCGGLGELRDIATLCDVYGVPVAPHNLTSPVGTVAAVHVCASIPNAYYLEYRGGDAPWWGDVVTRTGSDAPILQDGSVDLPEGPGLGVEIDTDVVSDRLTDESELIV